MFSKKALAELLDKHSEFFKDLVAAKTHLNGRFFGLSEEIHCLVLAVASGESMLLIGPPGTAKSRLIRAFTHFAGLIGKDDIVSPGKAEKSQGLTKLKREDRYFEYLLTPFTEPNELFGYFDIGKLMSEQKAGGKLERLHQGMMQHAEVVFLDEVFNASSAILNSLLTFVNERKFHDRGDSYAVKLSCLFGATNYPPRKPELMAIYDRFLLRSWVDNARARTTEFGELLQAGWKETNAAEAEVTRPQLLNRAEAFQRDVRAMSADGRLAFDLQDDAVNLMMARLADIAAQARREHFSLVSNRRLVRFSKIFLINALLRAAEADKSAPEITVHEDLAVFIRFGLDREIDPQQRNSLESLLIGKK